MVQRLAATLTLIAGLAGCAVGNQYDYRSASLQTAPANGTLAIGVIDARAYVLSGDKSPRFVGFQQDGYGNSFVITTQSGAPLATDLAEVLEMAFASGTAAVTSAPLAPGTRASSAVEVLGALKTDRLLLVELREWKTDALADIKIDWNLTADVYDRSGRLLASENSQGFEGTGTLGGVLEEQKAQLAVAEAGKRLTELLSRPAIAAALQ
ncbi:MAG: hypothetical protein AAGH74_12490 [Pseudomonadota bacterium]